MHQDLRAFVAVVGDDGFLDFAVAVARGFDGDADFVVAADFAVPKVLAGDGFVLHAGGKLLFQQQAADFFGGLFFVSQQMDKPEIV